MRPHNIQLRANFHSHLKMHITKILVLVLNVESDDLLLMTRGNIRIKLKLPELCHFNGLLMSIKSPQKFQPAHKKISHLTIAMHYAAIH